MRVRGHEVRFTLTPQPGLRPHPSEIENAIRQIKQERTGTDWVRALTVFTCSLVKSVDGTPAMYFTVKFSTWTAYGRQIVEQRISNALTGFGMLEFVNDESQLLKYDGEKAIVGTSASPLHALNRIAKALECLNDTISSILKN